MRKYFLSRCWSTENDAKITDSDTLGRFFVVLFNNNELKRIDSRGDKSGWCYEGTISRMNTNFSFSDLIENHWYVFQYSNEKNILNLIYNINWKVWYI